MAGADGRGKDRTGLFSTHFQTINEDTGQKLLDWLSSGGEMVEPVLDFRQISDKLGLSLEENRAISGSLKDAAKAKGVKLSDVLIDAWNKQGARTCDSVFAIIADLPTPAADSKPDEGEGKAVESPANPVVPTERPKAKKDEAIEEAVAA